MKQFVFVALVALVMACAPMANAKMSKFPGITVDVPNGWKAAKSTNGVELRTSDGLEVHVETFAFREGLEQTILDGMINAFQAKDVRKNEENGMTEFTGNNGWGYFIKFCKSGHAISYAVTNPKLMSEKYSKDFSAIMQGVADNNGNKFK